MERDTPEILPRSRKYFQIFWNENIEDFEDARKEYRVGRDETDFSTGYSPFYDSDEVENVMFLMCAALREEFADLSIPSVFTSADKLLSRWRSFHSILKEKDQLFERIAKRLIGAKPDRMGREVSSYDELPTPFHAINSYRLRLLDVLEATIGIAHEEIDMPRQVPEQHHADLVIIVALDDPEYVALLKLPGPWEKVTLANDNAVYHQTFWNNRRVVIAHGGLMGLPHSAALAMKCAIAFSPQYIVLGGIAGGIREAEISYGDPIVAMRSWNYEAGKWITNSDTNQKEFRPDFHSLDIPAPMKNAFESFLAGFKAEEEIRPLWTDGSYVPSEPLRIHLKNMASGSAVISQHEIVAELRARDRALGGIDMECYAVYVAAECAPISGLQFLCIKSISDFADELKDDKHRRYAAFTSSLLIYRFAINELLA